MKAFEALEKGSLNYDCVLVTATNKTEISAVKVLLERMSPVFAKKLKEQRVCSDDGLYRISIPIEYDVSSIDYIVQYSLGMDFKVKPKLLLNMRAAAKYYQIEPLFKALDAKIMKRIRKEESFCYFFHSSFQRNGLYMDTVSKCLDAFQNQLDHEKVFLSKYFLCLDYDPDLCTLFKTSKLKVNPSFLLRRLQKWASYKSVSPQILEKVSSFVCFRQKQEVYRSNSIPQFEGEPVRGAVSSIPQFDSHETKHGATPPIFSQPHVKSSDTSITNFVPQFDDDDEEEEDDDFPQNYEAPMFYETEMESENEETETQHSPSGFSQAKSNQCAQEYEGDNCEEEQEQDCKVFFNLMQRWKGGSLSIEPMPTSQSIPSPKAFVSFKPHRKTTLETC